MRGPAFILELGSDLVADALKIDMSVTPSTGGRVAVSVRSQEYERRTRCASGAGVRLLVDGDWPMPGTVRIEVTEGADLFLERRDGDRERLAVEVDRPCTIEIRERDVQHTCR